MSKSKAKQAVVNDNGSALAVVEGKPITMDKSNVLQSAAEFRKWITISEEGFVSFVEGAGANITLDGLGAFAAEKANASTHAGIIGANTLLLAKSLPAVTVNGQTVLAYTIACQTAEALCASPASFYRIRDLVPALEAKALNGWTAAPDTIRNGMPTLKRLGLVDDRGKLVSKTAAKHRMAKALAEGMGGNKVAEIVTELNEAAGKVSKAAAAKKADEKQAAQALLDAEFDKAAKSASNGSDGHQDSVLKVNIRNAGAIADKMSATGQGEALKAVFADQEIRAIVLQFNALLHAADDTHVKKGGV